MPAPSPRSFPLLRRTLLALAACALVQPALCNPAAATSAAAPSAPAQPCDDFDAYVNGAWLAATELPPDRARVGSFDLLRVANDRLLEAALADLMAKPELQATPGLKLLATMVRSGMDEAAIERGGLAAVAPLLARIAALKREELPQLLADLGRTGLATPLSFSVSPDAKDVTRYALQIGQAGLGLPDRDDYLKTDAESLRVQKAYRLYAQQLLAAARLPDGLAVVDALMAFEAELARSALTSVQRRDPQALYNPQTLASLAALAPGLDWAALLTRYTQRDAAALAGVPTILSQPAFAQAMARLAAQAPVEHWQHYLRVRLLDAVAEKLPKVYAQAHFDYRQTALRGITKPPPRAEQLTQTVGGPFGGAPLAPALGELYVSRAFSPTAQQRANVMVEDIRRAMAERIRALPWMSPTTRQRALEKLQAMVAQIGGPAQPRPWDGLVLRDDDYAGNTLRADAWAVARNLRDLGQTVDRLRWNTSPHIVNAFAAGGNRIVFPAGILQPPFFDPRADDASNYGAIGTVIGHEITHHFDDRGRQFDAVGNLRDWWTAEDAVAYRQRAERLAAFYSAYEPVPGVKINGQQMLGENISDLGGVQIAYDGLKFALERARKAGTALPLIDGHTPEQRFFLANALIWRSKTRVEALTQQLRTGQHSPGRYRVLGPLSHTAAFAQAFACSKDARMVAAEPIVIW